MSTAITWDFLWEKEKQLILLLDQIQEKRFLKEGSRKTLEMSDKSVNIFDSISQMQQKVTPKNSPIVMPDRNIFSSKSPDFTDDFMGNLRSLEAQLQKNQLTIPGLMLNITTEKNKPISRSEESLNMPITIDSEIQSLIHEASQLSVVIFEAHYKLDKEQHYLCDTLTVKEANLKTGGDGYKTINGEKVELPDSPLSKTCPKRKGSREMGRWLFECVVCPVNYLQTAERLKNWQDFLSSKTKTKSNGE